MVNDHNKSVRQALRGPDQNEELAESLSDKLLGGQSITFGGIVATDANVTRDEKPRPKRKSRKLGTSRGRKS